MSDTNKLLTDIRFDSFPLDPRLLRALADVGFERCTPIQAEALPVALEGKDVAGQAQTGTGKTLAFALALLQRLLSRPEPEGRKPNQPRALVLAPTRELAVQVEKDVAMLVTHTDFRTLAVFGGTGYQQQRDAFEQGVDVLIGTPGRLIDYFKQHVYNLKAAEVIVLDEADRMFDLGFIKDIRYLLRRMPDPMHRQGMLFSATLSYRVTELAYEHMNNPVTVAVEADKVTADKVTQVSYMTANDEKVPLLIGLLRQLEARRTMVFVNTKREAEKVWGFLQGNGYPSALLTGDVPQRKRLKLLKDFQEGALPVLVATDVAARGLHIPDVSHVINYDLPEDAEDYVHRIGRTARAGASGDAISFACERYAFCMPDIEQFIGHRIAVGSITAELLAEVDPASRVRVERAPRPERGRGAGRGSGSGRGDSRRQGGRPHRRPPAAEGQEPKADGEAAPPKRRRRRRKPGGGGSGSGGSGGSGAGPGTSGQAD
jgi:ATP-dependent RNA helicase RhlB